MLKGKPLIWYTLQTAILILGNKFYHITYLIEDAKK